MLVAVPAISIVHAIGATTEPTTKPDSTRAPFIASLNLKADRIIADSTHPMILWLSQTSPVAYRPSGPVKLKMVLAVAPRPYPTTDNRPVNAGDPATVLAEADAKPIVKDLGTIDVIPPRDLHARPLAMSAVFDGVPDGNYRIQATLTEGDDTVAKMEQTIWLVNGIDAKRGGIVDRLAKISGHDGTKATILYPFDVARVVNSGRRGYNAADLGINQPGLPNYIDFAKQINHSEELLSALEAGNDLLWQAKGEVERHYYFAEADEIMPYHVFVPPTWDGKTPLPMVFVLHGNTRNQDFYFDRDEHIIPKLAEKHGFMMVGVFGYHPNGGYNLGAMPGQGRGGAGGGGAARGGAAAAPAFGLAAGAGGRRGGAGGGTMGALSHTTGELSEIDTMNVYDLVKKEYPIDPKRTFLFGYSAGGNGGYYIAGKYADNWAAVSLGGANLRLSDTYPYYDKLKSLTTPFFIYYGEKDTVGPGSQASVQTLKDHGLAAILKSYPNVDHDGGPAAGADDAFDFFDANPRK
jgi:poly(3-hydroxybutyrate) depolymerase